MASTSRVVLYLQDQTSLDLLPACFPGLTAINLASFHFGYNADHSSYIHLNDTDVNDPSLLPVWKLMAQAQEAGVKVVAMLGGAGGAYGRLFSDYETFYPMWTELLRARQLDGVDLDVEEPVTAEDLGRLIGNLRADFSDLLITAAPVAEALSSGSDPLCGINWRQFADALSWFNVQFYSGYGSLESVDDYNAIIAAGYWPGQILAGCLTNPRNGGGYVPIAAVCSTLTALNAQYGGQLGGAMGWEQYNANNPDEQVDPVGWVAAVLSAMDSHASVDEPKVPAKPL